MERKTMETRDLVFNMHGYVIRFDIATHSWNWSKWEYANFCGFDGKRRIIRRTGGLEFMKMFPSLFGIQTETLPSPLDSKESMEAGLKKHGIDFVFLYQGDVTEEPDFSSIEEAEREHRVDSLPIWDLTEYWFSYSADLQSWAMYDAFSGDLEFTPATAAQHLQESRQYHHISSEPAYAAATQNITYH